IALLLPAAALAQTQTSSAPRPLIARCYENHARDSLLLERTLALHGAGEARIAFPATNGRDVLVYAIEQGVDVQLEAQGAAGDVLSIGDSPITRAGVQRVWIASTS